MSDILATVTGDPLEPSTVDEFVWRTDAGAVVSFQGIVRDLSVLQGANKIFLVAIPAVREDLEMRPKQREEIDKLLRHNAQRLQADFHGARPLTEEERRRNFIDMLDRMHDGRIIK